MSRGGMGEIEGRKGVFKGRMSLFGAWYSKMVEGDYNLFLSKERCRCKLCPAIAPSIPTSSSPVHSPTSTSTHSPTSQLPRPHQLSPPLDLPTFIPHKSMPFASPRNKFVPLSIPHSVLHKIGTWVKGRIKPIAMAFWLIAVSPTTTLLLYWPSMAIPPQ